MQPTDCSSCAGIVPVWIGPETQKLKHSSGTVMCLCTACQAECDFSSQPCQHPVTAYAPFIKLEVQTGLLPLFSLGQRSGQSCWMERAHLKVPSFLTWDRAQKQAEISRQDNTEEWSFVFLQLPSERHLSPYKTFTQSQNQMLKSRCYGKLLSSLLSYQAILSLLQRIKRRYHCLLSLCK